ncbi:hypothetical protein PQR66_39880 [Paraburkholderia agricolaris]|jgi:hypothetical protein|uniref:DUF6984 domain-containing protein n=1 Tax=Paraburkholderia agricolaris TaxID=2152888 RepID=A0ABW9A3S9_9BURK
MFRDLSANERQIILKLVGQSFPSLDALAQQLDGCAVEEIEAGTILRFSVMNSPKIFLSCTVLGEGSIDDIDGVPIILTVLQRDGYIHDLDINRADGLPVRLRFIDPVQIRVLGFGGGLLLG